MHVARGLEHLPRSDEPAFVVVGVFDGLHLGHAYLLEHLSAEAGRRDARPVVITFDHHPDEILTGLAPPLLCDPDERLERLAAAGVDSTVVVHFDQRLRETTYDAFVAMIADRAPLAGVLMTPDAAFGYRRAGTPETLAVLGAAHGFEVVVVPPFELDGRAVRSTEVRAAISSGDLATAARLLGRQHCIAGRAMEAATGPGSLLRFPLPVALPPDGTYEVQVGPVHAGRSDRAIVAAGTVRLLETPPVAWTRVEFQR
jgi:riboflavin kinase/FMN adenylyltransferase